MRRALLALGVMASLTVPSMHTLVAQPVTASMKGKTVLVTGSTDGLGREVAISLGTAGAHVIVHGRNVERGAEVVREIVAQGNGSARFIAADFGSVAAVRAFADTIAALYPRLDLLVNNAGVYVPPDRSNRTSADGYEIHLAINYLPGWILSHRLQPSLRAASPSRIINVASISAEPIDFGDAQVATRAGRDGGYGRSKLAQITMTKALAPEFAKLGITMVSLHPATLMNTNLVVSAGMPVQTTVQEGVSAVLALVNAPSLVPGAYFNGRNSGTPHPQATDTAAHRQLRTLSQRLTKVP